MLDGYSAVANPHQAFHQHGKDAVAAFRAGEPLRGMELAEAGKEEIQFNNQAPLCRIWSECCINDRVAFLCKYI